MLDLKKEVPKLGQWGSEFINAGKKPAPSSTLEAAVADLNSKTKRAFYSAILRTGTLARKTWDGCAYNQGGIELGDKTINSSAAAAELFECDVTVVGRFINAWDSFRPDYSDKQATQALLEILEKVGILNEPTKAEKPKGEKRSYRIVVWEGYYNDSALKDAILDGMDIEGTVEAFQLLFAEQEKQLV